MTQEQLTNKPCKVWFEDDNFSTIEDLTPEERAEFLEALDKVKDVLLNPVKLKEK